MVIAGCCSLVMSLIRTLIVMTVRLQYVFLLLTVVFQSCSMCSSTKMDTSVVLDDSMPAVESGYRKPWSKLSTIGYPIISDTIPNLLLERYCYSVSYNKFTRQPNWVMWELS